MARDRDSIGLGDTIVARATAAGEGAVAIVRLSGVQAHAIARRLFVPAGATHPVDDPTRLVLGTLHDGEGAPLDQCLVVAWRAPASLTGEDVIEFHLHGSPSVVRRVVGACLAAGARVARGGEFTRRAFLNGKVDLAQAEAVCELVRARTEAASRAALAQLGGGLSRRLDAMRAGLLDVLAELEASVDFPEEGIETATLERLVATVHAARGDMESLAASVQRGRRLREGARVVLAGLPNAGKSSLLNALARRDRALVSPHPGTTRDTVEADVDLGGVPVTLVDTAGLRDDAGEVESMGIARTREEAASADLVVFVIDGAEPGDFHTILQGVREAPLLIVANKADRAGDSVIAALRARVDAADDWMVVSAKTGAGLRELEARIIARLGAAGEVQDVLVLTERHGAALAEALSALDDALTGLREARSPELVAVDVSGAIHAVDGILGRRGLDEDVLDAIFSRFCLGK